MTTKQKWFVILTNKCDTEDGKHTFMPDMLASMYFSTDEPMTGKLFKFQPDVMYSWKQHSGIFFC